MGHDTNDFITMIWGMILILNTIIQKQDTNDFIGMTLILNSIIQEHDTNDFIAMHKIYTVAIDPAAGRPFPML